MSSRAAPLVGLVLTGGGARAAYQVGVLQGVRAVLDDAHIATETPFDVIVGTSAGAINAVGLAVHTGDFHHGVETLARVWAHLDASQVYRTDFPGVARTGYRWLSQFAFSWLRPRGPRANRPRALLDHAPLGDLLARLLDPHKIEHALNGGGLHALAVTASDYSSGRHVTFFDGASAIEPWTRSQRIAIHESISVQHLLASSAIPFVFPAVPLMCEGELHWFGDGSMRQLAPLSPAIHLGAQRVLVVGAGQIDAPHRFAPPPGASDASRYPSLAQIAGHALSSIFLDSLAMDLERIERVNTTVRLVPPDARARTRLREIDVLTIAPSQRIDAIAAQHVGALPSTVRAMLRAVGATEASGAALSSYLLFEASFTQALMQLGRDDTLARRSDVLRFFSSDA